MGPTEQLIIRHSDLGPCETACGSCLLCRALDRFQQEERRQQAA